MKSFLVGVLIGICLVAGGAFWYFFSGRAPVATSAAPMPLERFMAKSALKATLSREAPKEAPMQPTKADLVAGAQVYQQDCAFCHGLPQQPPTTVSRGMFPPPPQLFSAKGGVTDDPVGVTYWKVKDGIRLSGMPGFHDSLTDQQMWQVSFLLAQADKLPAEAQAALRPAASGTPNPAAGAPAAH